MPTLLTRGTSHFGNFGSHSSGFGSNPFAPASSSKGKGPSNWWDIVSGWNQGWPRPGQGGFPGNRPWPGRPGGGHGHTGFPGSGNSNHGGGGGGGNNGSGGGGSGGGSSGGNGGGGSGHGGGGSGNGGGGGSGNGGNSGNGGGSPPKGGGGANNSGENPHSGGDGGHSKPSSNPSTSAPPPSDHSTTGGSAPPSSTDNAPTTPGSTLTLPPTTSSTITSVPTLPSSQVSASRHINVAAIVAPIVTILLLICALVLWFYYRRRRSMQPTQQQLGSVSDVSSLTPSRDQMPSFANTGGMILPPRTEAARMRGGLGQPIMREDPAHNRPVSFASSAFAFQNPFASRAAAMASTTTLGSASGFGDHLSVAGALGHSGASDEATIPDGAVPPMLGQTLGALPLYAHHAHRASTSGSIVGSGMFSLASAQHGHSSGGTPAAQPTDDPFADRHSWGGESSPGVPWPALASSDGHGGPVDWRHSHASSSGASMFVPATDAPPVPPLSPETPGSAAPLMEHELARARHETFGRGQLPVPISVQTPGGESLYPATPGTRDSYFGVSSGVEEEEDDSPGASSAEVGEARRASVSTPALVSAPSAASSRPLQPSRNEP